MNHRTNRRSDGGETMTSVSELEELLDVENIHSSHFEDWEKVATDPLAKMAFRLAADKERNHVRWVKLLIEIARAKERGTELGVARDDLAFWVEDESSEGRSYTRMLPRVEEPWIRLVLRQLAHDEDTNAEILRTVLTSAR